MEDGQGQTVSDLSGNGNHGTFSTGMLPTCIPGKVGGALEFRGLDSYVNCQNAALFDVTDAVSVAAWVNINTVPTDWTAIAAKGNDAWRLSTVFSTTRMHFGVTGIPDHWSIDGDTEVTPGYWHYVVGTYDGTNIRIFVDGVEDAEPVPYDGGITTNQDDVWIGGNSDKPGREFDGLIDEVALWNRALTVTEIDGLFNDGMGIPVVTRDGIYVDDDAPHDPAPGDPAIGDPDENGSWSHPFDSIQEAINAADAAETVIVMDGTYTGPGNRGIFFDGKEVTLRSRNGPENCIIDCEQADHGIWFSSDVGPETVLQGFTVTNGRPIEMPYGGGIYCDMASPTIRDCIIFNNQAESGAGIFLEFSSAVIDDCIIIGNTAQNAAGGILAFKSDITLIDSTITANSPEGMMLEFGSASVLGRVTVIADTIAGDGVFNIDAAATMRMANAATSTNLAGLGRILVPTGTKLTVENAGIIDMTDPASPGIRGTLQCDGFLLVTDVGSLTRTAANVTHAVFESSAVVSDNVFTTNTLIPYGQIAVEDSAVFVNNDIHSKGDRYTDVEPQVFAGTIHDNRIFVKTAEGQAGTPGGLFELRGRDMFCQQQPCEPGLIPLPEVPDFAPNTWTIERLELLDDAKLTLTNREDYQAPFDSEGDQEVLYVKQLVLGPGSVLDTSFSRVYYQNLSMHPSAKVVSRPLLGYSLDRILFENVDEYSNRILNNNVLDPEEPTLTRIHVERVLDAQLDPTGLMTMRNLPDLDQTSPTFGLMINARAKGLFARCTEEQVLIRFKYHFDIAGPNTMLAVYLSDIPYLLDKDDPDWPVHHIPAGLLPVPPAPRPGSVGSGRFAVFETKIPTEGLDLTDGTFVEFELIDPCDPNVPPDVSPYFSPGLLLEADGEGEDGSGGSAVTIDDWGPEVHCDGICLDITRDSIVDEVDFLTVVGRCGSAAELDPNETGSLACLEGAFSDDGYVDILDVTGWDWTLCDDDREWLCDGIPLSDMDGATSSPNPPPRMFGMLNLLVTLPDPLDDLLILGKRSSTGASEKLEDRIYMFDKDPDYNTWFAPSSNRSNLRLVPAPDGSYYQINSESGIVELNSTDDVVVPPGVCTGVTEPRYGTSATVYVGIQLEEGAYEDESVGRPILDAAFDDDYVYVLPVVVNPAAGEPYAAAAKLQLLGSGSPPYSIVKLYDDPPLPADNQYRNALREIEIDDEGNIYVLNAHSLNESDILCTCRIRRICCTWHQAPITRPTSTTP